MIKPEDTTRIDHIIVAIVRRLFTYRRKLLLVHPFYYPMQHSFLQRNYLVITWWYKLEGILFRANTGEKQCKFYHFDNTFSIMISLKTQDNAHLWGDISVHPVSQVFFSWKCGLFNLIWITTNSKKFTPGIDCINVPIEKRISHKNIILRYTWEYTQERNHIYAIIVTRFCCRTAILGIT